MTAHNTIVRKLLFEAATFHGLAKLRLHMETTVTDLEHSLTRLGDGLRAFQNTVCPAYRTADLPTEEAARIRRQANAAKKAVLRKSAPDRIKLLGHGWGGDNPMGFSTKICT